MSWKPDEEEEHSALIAWKAKELPTPSETSPGKQKRSFAVFMRDLWGAVRGYAAAHVERLQEAGVQMVEGKALREVAEGKAKLAEAGKLHAEEEKTRAEARAIDQETVSKERMDRIAALERLAAAMSAIRQAGGDVAFDAEELKRLALGTKDDPKELAGSGSAE